MFSRVGVCERTRAKPASAAWLFNACQQPKNDQASVIPRTVPAIAGPHRAGAEHAPQCTYQSKQDSQKGARKEENLDGAWSSASDNLDHESKGHCPANSEGGRAEPIHMAALFRHALEVCLSRST